MPILFQEFYDVKTSIHSYNKPDLLFLQETTANKTNLSIALKKIGYKIEISSISSHAPSKAPPHSIPVHPIVPSPAHLCS